VVALIVARDGVVEGRVDAGGRRLRIGRDPGNEVVLRDPARSVSRFHAELREEAGSFVLLDLGSQNGTWVDGERIQRADLRPGVAAVIGPFTLTLEAAEPAAASAESRWRAARSAAVSPAPSAGAPRRPADGPVTPGRPEAAPVRRRAAPAGPPQGTGPIAWLARQPKPLVFGGFLAVTIVAVLVASWFGPSDAPPPPQAAPAATTEGVSNSQAVAGLLVQARARLEQGDPEGALRHIERALAIIPDDPESLDLRMRAEEQRRKGPRPPSAGTPR
jgi:predicted component of type VI protein secretion system